MHSERLPRSFTLRSFNEAERGDAIDGKENLDSRVCWQSAERLVQ